MNNAKLDPSRNMDVLIVDDNSSNLKLLSNILKNAGYKVRAANDGVLALRSAHAEPPALIVLDILMPHMNGYEVSKHLKEDKKTRTIPIIFISALSDEQERIKGFQAGCVDYVCKPFNTEEVLARVTTHLTLYNMQVDLEAKNTQLLAEIQERKKIEEEREQLIHELQESIVKIKTLSGLLPICSMCKKIRDDKGYWNQVEKYIMEHSDAKFTHGVCPECFAKYYADFATEQK